MHDVLYFDALVCNIAILRLFKILSKLTARWYDART